MQKWYNWLEEVKKKDEKAKMKEMHQHKVAQLIESAEESAVSCTKSQSLPHGGEGRSFW